MNKKDNFILASVSKARLELLKRINYEPKLIVASDIDESILNGETPKNYSIRIAIAKAKKIVAEYPNDLILAADTVTCVGRRILPKTDDIKIARSYLKLMSGRRHRVYTSVCLFYPDGKKSVRTVLSTLKLKRLDEKEIDEYLDMQQWANKSGGCDIDGYYESFVSWMSGSNSAIIGLPINSTLADICNSFAKSAKSLLSGPSPAIINLTFNSFFNK